jgi:hypothetical protein
MRILKPLDANANANSKYEVFECLNFISLDNPNKKITMINIMMLVMTMEVVTEKLITYHHPVEPLRR